MKLQVHRPPIKFVLSDGNVWGVVLYGIIQKLLIPEGEHYQQNEQASHANTLMVVTF